MKFDILFLNIAPMSISKVNIAPMSMSKVKMDIDNM